MSFATIIWICFERQEHEMIKDHVTFSARAEKPRRVLLNLVALAVGGCISLAPYAAQALRIQTLAPSQPAPSNKRRRRSRTWRRCPG